MAKIPFYKFHGTGNDFIIIDNRELKFVPEGPGEIAGWCNRRFGIGADGLILLEQSGAFDFRMVYYNADGNQSSMCGNGGRCIVAFAAQLGLITGETTFEAIDGIHEAVILNQEFPVWNISLRMNDVTRVIIDNNHYILDTGSPHYVTPTTGLADADIVEEGRRIRYSESFREKGINVNLIEFGENKTSIRTYERGVEAETFSCGTGSVAAAIVTDLKGKRKLNEPVNIETLGGMLRIKFKNDGDEYTDIWLEGPAAFVYEGTINRNNK